jgi:hypothetical protein
MDSGSPDSGTPDSGEMDAGEVDAGLDAAVPDAGAAGAGGAAGTTAQAGAGGPTAGSGGSAGSAGLMAAGAGGSVAGSGGAGGSGATPDYQLGSTNTDPVNGFAFGYSCYLPSNGEDSAICHSAYGLSDAEVAAGIANCEGVVLHTSCPVNGMLYCYGGNSRGNPSKPYWTYEYFGDPSNLQVTSGAPLLGGDTVFSPDYTGRITARQDGCPSGAPEAVNRFRIVAAPGAAQLVIGAKVQGSNSGPTTDFVDLYTIQRAASESGYTSVTFPNTTIYRYIRYFAPVGSQGAVAELEFYHDVDKLGGQSFGTAGSTPDSVLDGNLSTTSTVADGGGGYIGLDVGQGHLVSLVSFNPAPSASPSPQDIQLVDSTPNADIYYSLNGGVSQHYSGSIHITQTTTITANATAPCLFNSPTSTGTFTIGQAVTGGLRTYHIGNSLTDTINQWLKPIADSTGVTHTYARWTIPGAPIKWLLEHEGQGFEDPAGASQFDTFVSTYAPIDHLTIQPYSDPDFVSQGGAAAQLLNTALQFSPQAQFWIYAQWAEKDTWSTDAMSAGYSLDGTGWTPPKVPTSWAEGTQNMSKYFEDFRDYVDPLVGGKPFRVIPAGLALVELKRQFDAGLIPGMSGDFFATFFEDGVHLKAQGQYLVSLVFYSCLYRQTPEGHVTYVGTSGLTPEQTLAFQRIAWSVSSGYAGSGI